MSLISNETSITALTGPPFVVIVVNWALFGVLSIQVYLYFQAFAHDRNILKILVFGVYLLEMTQTLMLTETIWSMLASGFGNLEPLDQIGTTWLSVCCIGGLVGLLVQWFYAYRIVVISGKRTMPAFIILMSLASFAGALASAVNTKRAKRFSNLEADEVMTFAMLALWGGIGSVCDVAIAICMCYYLRRYSHDELGIFSRTQALLSKIIRITIETGTLTG
ncbi:hypothetical protein BJ912DRAFT_958790 [Pholiota molesta]|nr:hypothetical protein BJ912DRAFT_958790 [Pholiota molesta]